MSAAATRPRTVAGVARGVVAAVARTAVAGVSWASTGPVLPALASATMALLATALLTAPVDAQSPATLGARCVDAGGDVDPCLAGATAAYSFSGHASLQSGLGAPVPGSASALGTRVGGGPRLAFFGQLSASSWDLPDLAQPLTERSSWVPSFRVGAAAGLFDGFRIMPTVGGFLATDLFADASLHLPSGSEGFGGNVSSLSAGARVGIFREGFTVPGVSVSVARRIFGESSYGDLLTGDLVGVAVDPAVTSIRAMVSKDLFAVELLAGFGWDDFSGDTTLEVTDGVGGVVTVTGPVEGSRELFFASASMTFSLVFSLTVEGGWAGGLSPVPAYVADHDPSGGTGFASLSARLVL